MPVVKAASTAVIAWTVWPNTSPIIRSQTTS
jgi:hypothetical protein